MPEDYIGDALHKALNSDIEIPLETGVPDPDKIAESVLDDMMSSDDSRSTTPTRSRSPTPKRRGRPPGSTTGAAKRRKTTATPPPEQQQQDLPRGVRDRLSEGLGIPNIEAEADYALITMRKRVMRLFQYFGPTRLQPYFGGQVPPVHSMGMHELKNLEATIDFYLNDCDDTFYPKLILQTAAGVIESVGPSISKRLPYIPGIDLLNHAHGLSKDIGYLAEIEGDDGIKDELVLLSIKYDTYKPSSPEFKLVGKLAAILSAKRETVMRESVNQSKMNI